MKKVLFLANRDFVLYNFRFELIQRLIDENYTVFFAVPDGPKNKLMQEIGAKYIPISVNGRGTNPFEDLYLIKCLFQIYKNVKPDIVLLYTTKISIYGGIVAGIMKVPYLLNVSGLGTAVGQKSILQRFTILLYKMATKHSQCVFFQNQQNLDFFHENNIVCKKEKLIPGSGVNIQKWNINYYPPEENGIYFIFVARIIKEKGIEEYLNVAKKVKKKNLNTHFGIVGPIDGNYSEMIKAFEEENIVTYYGEALDTKQYLYDSHCLVHPSYYPEGISNVCLEAASCNRPVITTDNPGCKETVINNITGYIVRMRDQLDLQNKLEQFIELPWDRKREMGRCARKMVSEHFDRNIVINSYLEEISRI